MAVQFVVQHIDKKYLQDLIFWISIYLKWTMKRFVFVSQQKGTRINFFFIKNLLSQVLHFQRLRDICEGIFSLLFCNRAYDWNINIKNRDKARQSTSIMLWKRWSLKGIVAIVSLSQNNSGCEDINIRWNYKTS